MLTFEGVVRPAEPAGPDGPDGPAEPGGGDTRPLAALRYEAYEPMTTRELSRLAAAVGGEYGAALEVTHSVGTVPAGAVSFRLRVATPHRAAGLACCGDFIDRMKRDVPLWKVPVWDGD